jgi:DNA cross-link repair 1A protein
LIQLLSFEFYRQPTLNNYFTRTGENYFTCHKQSSLPTGVLQPIEDLSMSQFLQIDLAEGSQFLNESDLKPHEGVQFDCISDVLQNAPMTTNILDDLMNKIYAPVQEVLQLNLEKKLVAVESESEDESEKMAEVSGKKKPRKKAICPTYKVIEGSLFAVDAFRYGSISYVEHYFLTHFHADHYIGLRKKFSHKIYLSQITAVLVSQFIGVADELLNVCHVGLPFYLEGCKITPMEANHCPGALLFLFQFSDGRNILHTGDFRANEKMVQQLNEWDIKLDLVYLDTTYLSSKRRMPPQNESIKFVLENVQRYLETNIGEKFLIIVGAYLIGKEKVWMSIARHFNFKVFLEKERLKAFKAICSCSAEHLEVFKNHVVEDEDEADVRVTSMIQLSYPVRVFYKKL